MEAFGIAGGAVSLISLFIQLIEQVDNIHEFWKSFRDAPEEVNAILQDLEQFRDLLSERAKSISVPTKLYLNVVAKCEKKLQRLESLLEKLEPGFKSRRRIVRAWRCYTTALHKNDIKRFQEALTAAKGDLILVNQNIAEQAQDNHFAILTSKLESLGMEHSKSVATSLSSAASSKVHLTEINEHLQDLKMQMLEMKGSFPHWMDSVQSPFMVKAMNALVEKAVHSAFSSQEMKEMLHSLVTQALSSRPNVERLGSNSMSAQHLPNGDDRPSRPMHQNYLNRVCEQEYVSQYTSILGTLYYRSQIVRIGRLDDVFGEYEQKELETSWTIIPSTWLLGKGLSLWVARSTQGWKHNIEYFPIVPHDALIFKYSLEGNVDGVRHLLQQRLASPRDCDDQGFTALHRAAALRHVDLCALLLRNGAPANAASFFTRETALHQLPVNRSRVRCGDLLETVRILVERGNADPALPNFHQQTAAQVFWSFFRWPGRITLRREMSKSLVWLRSSAPLELDVLPMETVEERLKGNSLNGFNVDAEVETLDALLAPGTDVNAVFGPQRCPGSFLRGWTGLHVLMHLRIEPVWHPWSIGAIYQQGALWSDAMCRIMEQGTDPHYFDWQGNTPTGLALRSLYTFHLWQNAVSRLVPDLDHFIRREFASCPNLRYDGWEEESLQVLFHFTTERLYLHRAEWRERPELFHFGSELEDGLYLRCCWFQLLDILKTRSVLPSGWQILTLPREFGKERESLYWNKSERMLQIERPPGGNQVNMAALREAGKRGEDLADVLANMGVVWQA